MKKIIILFTTLFSMASCANETTIQKAMDLDLTDFKKAEQGKLGNDEIISVSVSLIEKLCSIVDLKPAVTKLGKKDQFAILILASGAYQIKMDALKLKDKRNDKSENKKFKLQITTDLTKAKVCK
jgi:hypothetical protein